MSTHVGSSLYVLLAKFAKFENSEFGFIEIVPEDLPITSLVFILISFITLFSF